MSITKKIEEWDSSIFSINFAQLGELTPIGSGNFGQVFKGELFGLPVAVKQLMDAEDELMHKYIQREINILRDLRHPNVVQFMGLSRNNEDVYIVTEFVPGGDLHNLLTSSDQVLDWRVRIQMAIDVAQALSYLHGLNKIHRDLKSSNLLVSDNNKIKVCDFGFSRTVDSENLMTLCGTDEWMAPEILCEDEYDFKADVFSFGMILIELITRARPPRRLPTTGYALDENKFRAMIPSDTPEFFANLVCLCGKWDPDERPTMIQCLNLLKEGLKFL